MLMTTGMLMTTRMPTNRMPVLLSPTSLFGLSTLGTPPLSLLTLSALFLGLFTPGAPIFGLFTSGAAVFGLFTPRITPLGLSNHDLSLPLFCSFLRFHLSLFSFPYFAKSGGVSHQNLNAYFCHATPPFPSLIRVFRATLLLLKEDYAV